MSIRIDYIVGSRRLSNYWWATVILFGGLGFILAGLSSYLKVDLLPFTKLNDLLFIPQGIIMIFYGIVAFVLGIFLWLTIFWNIGGGYNKFDTEENLIIIFRLGFPGKNRNIYIKYLMHEIQAIKVKFQDSFRSKNEIYLQTKDKREIPLTSVDKSLLLSELEKQATEIAKLLGVILEGV
jgi:Ycf4|uniref:Photosystem I assembly protein Ycf4 n=1 Tax=Thorea hispida TaxID=202687 RepID=A0A1C9CAG0_9FLOR|nr:photosystem I assembly protein Ycf4 [Thorea hispida]AOM65349.1 photosystem I assembly protein Ycf4 [Thorea hispida]ARX95910.1 photosystem I assembly protein Ycf4 [Thorea hispida]UNJ79081.1 photosystem I assembly protein Ycf4 [Thorea hispida]